MSFAPAFTLRMGSMVGVAVLQIASTTTILHLLGERPLACWTLLSQVVVLLSMLDIGLGAGIAKIWSDLERAPQERIRRFWGTVVAASWLLGLVYGGVMLAIGLVLPRAVGLDGAESLSFERAAAVFALWGCVRFRWSLPAWVAYGRARVLTSAKIDCAVAIARPLAALVMFSLRMPIELAALAFVLAEAIAYAVARRWVRLPERSRPSIESARAMAAYAGSTTFVSMIGGSYVYLMSYVVGLERGIADVNVYYSSTMIALLFMRVAVLPHQILIPIALKIRAQDGAQAMLRKSRPALTLYAALVVVGAVGAALVNREFVALWVGERFYAGLGFSCAFFLYTVLLLWRQTVQSILSTIMPDQWGLGAAHAVEIVVLLLAAPTALHYGFVPFALLLAAAHVIPLCYCMLRLAAALREDVVRPATEPLMAAQP